MSGRDSEPGAVERTLESWRLSLVSFPWFEKDTRVIQGNAVSDSSVILHYIGIGGQKFYAISFLGCNVKLYCMSQQYDLMCGSWYIAKQIIMFILFQMFIIFTLSLQMAYDLQGSDMW